MGNGSAALHFGRYLVGLDQADSQTTQAERACLAELAEGKRRAVEIGVYEGVGTRTIASRIVCHRSVSRRSAGRLLE
jgi:DNA-binding CsgD family transcriptional regulator